MWGTLGWRALKWLHIVRVFRECLYIKVKESLTRLIFGILILSLLSLTPERKTKNFRNNIRGQLSCVAFSKISVKMANLWNEEVNFEIFDHGRFKKFILPYIYSWVMSFCIKWEFSTETILLSYFQFETDLFFILSKNNRYFFFS